MSNNGKIRIPLISFFTGGGFFDLGLEQAGFQIAWTNENDPFIAEMYSCAMKSLKGTLNGHMIEISDSGSIIDIDIKQVLKKAFEGKPPEIFGVVGGPPCQDFSTAGNTLGFEGERGMLTGVFINKISELHPAFFIMENVEGLWKVKRNRLELLEKLKFLQKKYVVATQILNALEYGVPQDRKRLFIVGFSKKHFKNIDHEVSTYFKWPIPLYKDALKTYNWPLRSEFQEKPRKPYGIPNELCVQSCLISTRNYKVSNTDEVFNAYSEKFHFLEEGDTRKQSFKRLHRYRYSPTACYGNNEVHLHPYLPRRLSIREVLRIQGVPDEYVLPKYIGKDLTHYGLSVKFKMIGNGVPVPLAKHVGQAVKSFILTQIAKQNGHLDKGKAKRSNVANQVKGY